MPGDEHSSPVGSSFPDYVRDSLVVVERMGREIDRRAVDAAVDVIGTALGADRPLLVCGNGGSAADAMHITGELVGRFLAERRALNAICLSANPSIVTSIGNDEGFENVFSRQVEAYAAPGGVLLVISTSGRSPNVVKAAESAHRCEMTVVAMTGSGGGDLARVSDILLAVPSRSTPLIQQAHLVLYHFICAAVERRLEVAPAMQSVGAKIHSEPRSSKIIPR